MMPTLWLGWGYRRKTCRRKVSWSNRRGGCRFEPGHDGACKPGSGRA